MRKGFTLIELLLYLSIFAIMFSAMVLFAFAMLSTAENTNYQIEVAENSRFITQKVQQALRGSDQINTPLVNTSSNSLSFDTATASWNPFVIDVTDGVLRFKLGSNNPVAISNSYVTVSNVSFSHYVYSTNTKATIRFEATVSGVDPAQPVSKSIDLFISVQ